jgi:hypothetical protein
MKKIKLQQNVEENLRKQNNTKYNERNLMH